MQVLDRLIVKELIGPFLTGMFMFLMLVFAAGSMFQAADWLVQGVPAILVLKLILFSMPSLVTQTFPMAMLLAGLLGFGRLSGDSEAVAIFASGVSFLRMARWVFILGALVSITAYLWNDYVVPPSASAFWNLKSEAINFIKKSDKPIAYAIDRKDGKGVAEYITINGGYVYNSVRRVAIVKYSEVPGREGQVEAVLDCESAVANEQTSIDKWTFINGHITYFLPDKKTGKIEDAVPLTFQTLQPSPKTPYLGKSLEEITKADINDPNRKNFRELQKEIQRDKKLGYDARGKEVDLYGKISLPIASFIFGIVGAALGLNTRRGAGKTVGFGMAIFIVFLYWVFYHSMFVVGKNGGMNPMLASFLADIVGTIVAIFLAYRASR